MKKIPKIYLASSSQTRQNLLKEAGLEFEIIEQNADERSMSWNLPIEELVCKLAELKMAHVQIPSDAAIENNSIYILTADTLTEDINGNILGKPKNRDDSINQIKIARHGSKVSTGFCLEKKIFQNNAWITDKKVTKAVTSSCKLDIPDQFIDTYLEKTGALYGCGSIIIDGFGSVFTKEIKGSYTAILGLPLYEIFEALILIAD